MIDETFVIRVGLTSLMSTCRRSLQTGLQGWGCGNIDNMVLVFSELVTNASVHTSAASRTVITHLPPNVRLEVHDTSHAAPELRGDNHGEPGGFGLRIVNDLSASWGWLLTPTGKMVWSVIACDL